MFQIEAQSSKRLKLSETLPNRRSQHKSELCLKFQRGSCNYGDRCCFAHCIDELKGLEKRNELISIAAVDEKTNPRCSDRTKFCWRFMSGERCQYGDKCHFVHVKSDCENGEMVNRKLLLTWRTKLCYRWMMTGSCRYGLSCCYAHGESELQNQGLNDAHNYAEGGACKLVEKGGKQLKVKWKNSEKISRAYADWINDLPLVSHTI